MQVPKRHLPVVGVLGLLVVAAAGGSIAYYQYVHPPQTACGTHPVHRLIFMNAIIEERGGFSIFNAAILNQTSLPAFSNTTGANLTGLHFANYKTADNITLSASVDDTVTVYVKAISTNETGPTPTQLSSATGHGFDIGGGLNMQVVNGTLPTFNIPWGTWYTVTFHVTQQGTGDYHCTQTCSARHPQMRGGFSVGCGS
ncbi:MAG: hypothetical protein AUJ07_03725 [Crenarchaeota archaeon 13_1_40CM_3_53_5]|nr:MAG: hypothetical protein AUJ07_03725 [Crenarchaeota archaeon 13_1_40CM_3_53_5]